MNAQPRCEQQCWETTSYQINSLTTVSAKSYLSRCTAQRTTRLLQCVNASLCNACENACVAMCGVTQNSHIALCALPTNTECYTAFLIVTCVASISVGFSVSEVWKRGEWGDSKTKITVAPISRAFKLRKLKTAWKHLLRGLNVLSLVWNTFKQSSITRLKYT